MPRHFHCRLRHIVFGANSAGSSETGVSGVMLQVSMNADSAYLVPGGSSSIILPT